jgi:hypothetical protein
MLRDWHSWFRTITGAVLITVITLPWPRSRSGRVGVVPLMAELHSHRISPREVVKS